MIAQFQLVQEALDEFTLYFVLRKEASQGELDALARDILRSHVGPNAHVTCVEKTEIPRTAGGKMQVTLSRV